MDIALNRKKIIDICGTVSFKRGDAFYRNDKVRFKEYGAGRCVATVSGAEEFLVTITKAADGSIRTECSCPKLASFRKECQHVAAVLLAMGDHQRRGTEPDASGQLTENLLNLFEHQPARPSARQLHFENRKILDAAFVCEIAAVSKGLSMFGIHMKIGTADVKDIRAFLQCVKRSEPYKTFLYDPAFHCFDKETDAVIGQLIKVVQDEKIYMDSLPNRMNKLYRQDLLLIPPSSWEHLYPLLTRAPFVKLGYGGMAYEGLQLSEERLPLRFMLSEAGDGRYQLKVEGMEEMAVLAPYQSVLLQGKLITLRNEDCRALAELKGMLDASGTDRIPIGKQQLHFFLEKVVPGLKRLGEVELRGEHFVKTPLAAKLYVDRVSNRLLAGLEFHYGPIIINPLAETKINAPLVRDAGKEQQILELMEEGEFAKTDGGYFLQNEELEYRFLYHIMPKLQKLGHVYATTAVRNRIFRKNAAPRIKVRIKKERTNWLEFKFEWDGVPEQQIREVLAALEEKRKYYRLKNGALLSLESREFEEIQRFLHAVPVQNSDMETSFEVPMASGLRLLDHLDEGGPFKLEESFRQFLDSIEHPERLAFEVPEQMRPILRDYQVYGFQWMKTLAHYKFGGILADDMGLGKTVQSIAFILSELSCIREKKQPVLIVCPSAVTYNWRSEMMKFAPGLQIVIADGDKAARSRKRKEIARADVVIISYPLLRQDVKWYEKQLFHTVFFDEAQAFKNPATQTAKAVKRIQAEYRFALTGTPVENSLEELWSIFYVVFPELFRGLKEYSQLTKKAIARRIRPFLLRRLKEDVLAELPEKIETTESIELLSEQKQLYAAYLAKLRHDTLKHLDKDTFRKNRIKILAGLTRLRQICCHPALFVDGYAGGSAKYEQLMRIIEESKMAGRRVLVFSQFTSMLKLIGRELAKEGTPFLYLDGQTPSEERVALCNRFNEGGCDLFLISLKAGGTGLNLTGADTVVLYDLWWNPAVEEQAADRAHRMGQKNAVQVIKLVARGTIEDKMNELQEKKRHLIEEIIHPEDKASSRLTEEDIREILMI
ncbi:MAG: SNF2 helicase associated domain-containing protein [Bacillus sp. (in: firmicutes)]